MLQRRIAHRGYAWLPSVDGLFSTIDAPKTEADLSKPGSGE